MFHSRHCFIFYLFIYLFILGEVILFIWRFIAFSFIISAIFFSLSSPFIAIFLTNYLYCFFFGFMQFLFFFGRGGFFQFSPLIIFSHKILNLYFFHIICVFFCFFKIFFGRFPLRFFCSLSSFFFFLLFYKHLVFFICNFFLFNIILSIFTD